MASPSSLPRKAFAPTILKASGNRAGPVTRKRLRDEITDPDPSGAERLVATKEPGTQISTTKTKRVFGHGSGLRPRDKDLL